MRYALNTVPINGNETIYMVGAAAMRMDASGLTNQQRPFAPQTASIVLGALDAMKHAKALAGVAPLALDAVSGVRGALVMASDPATMALGLSWGITYPKPPPAAYSLSHHSRTGRVHGERRYAEVDVDDRAGQVPPEPRTGQVLPERNA